MWRLFGAQFIVAIILMAGNGPAGNTWRFCGLWHPTVNAVVGNQVVDLLAESGKV